METAGAVVTTAGSVPQALALLADGGTDLLVSDIGMPGQDGLDLIVQVRERGVTIPAIALTAFSIAHERERILGGDYAACGQADRTGPVRAASICAIEIASVGALRPGSRGASHAHSGPPSTLSVQSTTHKKLRNRRCRGTECAA